MKDGSKPVKLNGEVVDTATFPVYENADDLATIPLEKLLAIVNRQVCTDACNAARASHREREAKPSKKLEAFINVLEHKQRTGGPVEGPPEAIFQLSFRVDQTVDRDEFEKVIDQYRDKLLRLKGYIDFGENPIYIELCNEQLTEKPELFSEEPGSAFTVIAWNMDKEELKEAFERCWAG